MFTWSGSTAAILPTSAQQQWVQTWLDTIPPRQGRQHSRENFLVWKSEKQIYTYIFNCSQWKFFPLTRTWFILIFLPLGDQNYIQKHLLLYRYFDLYTRDRNFFRSIYSCKLRVPLGSSPKSRSSSLNIVAA